MNKNLSIATGSIRDVANKSGQSEVTAIMNASLVVCVDVSGSMNTHDAAQTLSRNDAAEKELRRLQEEYPGKIAVIAFSDKAEFCLNGIATRFGGGTNLMPAIALFEDLDGVADLVIVSDGEVDDASETLAACKKLRSKIQTIFIGDKTDPHMKAAIEFLKKLAACNQRGGSFSETLKPGMLAAPVRLMLGAPKPGAISL
jgi:uncharacterized protein with von Willebrand factor type A (vWA) domain